MTVYNNEEGPNHLFSIEKFEGELSIHDFIEELTAPFLQNDDDWNEKNNNSLSLDPKPFIQTFESALSTLEAMRAKVNAQEEKAQRTVLSAGSAHNKNIIKIQNESDRIMSQFMGLDNLIAEVSASVSSMGDKLQKLSTQRNKTSDASLLLEFYTGFYNGEKTGLDSLRNGNYSSQKHCARILRQLIAIAKKMADEGKNQTLGMPSTYDSFSTLQQSILLGNQSDFNSTNQIILPNAKKALTEFEKYAESFERDLLKQFDKAYRNAKINRMKEVADVLVIFNGGNSVIQVFVNQHDFFILKERLHDSSKLGNSPIWKYIVDPDVENPSIDEETIRMFDEIVQVIKSETEIILKIFPNPEAVLRVFIQRIFAQNIQQRVELLLTFAESLSNLAYLRALCLTYIQLRNMTTRIKDNFPASMDVNSLSVFLDQNLEDLFIPYLENGNYIEIEKVSLNELISNAFAKFNAAHKQKNSSSFTSFGLSRGASVANTANSKFNGPRILNRFVSSSPSTDSYTRDIGSSGSGNREETNMSPPAIPAPHEKESRMATFMRKAGLEHGKSNASKNLAPLNTSTPVLSSTPLYNPLAYNDTVTTPRSAIDGPDDFPTALTAEEPTLPSTAGVYALDSDGDLKISVGHSIIRWVIESVRRAVELSGNDDTPSSNLLSDSSFSNTASIASDASGQLPSSLSSSNASASILTRHIRLLSDILIKRVIGEYIEVSLDEALETASAAENSSKGLYQTAAAAVANTYVRRAGTFGGSTTIGGINGMDDSSTALYSDHNNGYGDGALGSDASSGAPYDASMEAVLSSLVVVHPATQLIFLTAATINVVLVPIARGDGISGAESSASDKFLSTRSFGTSRGVTARSVIVNQTISSEILKTVNRLEEKINGLMDSCINGILNRIERSLSSIKKSEFLVQEINSNNKVNINDFGRNPNENVLYGETFGGNSTGRNSDSDVCKQICSLLNLVYNRALEQFDYSASVETQVQLATAKADILSGSMLPSTPTTSNAPALATTPGTAGSGKLTHKKAGSDTYGQVQAQAVAKRDSKPFYGYGFGNMNNEKSNMMNPNLEHFLLRIGLGFRDLLLNTIQKNSFTSSGGLLLTNHIAQYNNVFLKWGIPEINDRLAVVRDIGLLYVVNVEVLPSMLRHGTLAQVKPQTLVPYLMRRSDLDINSINKIMENLSIESTNADI